jgi:hypothetical protein
MRRTTILAISAGLLMACGSGTGGGERRATPGARDPGQAEARSGTAGQPAAQPVPFGRRSDQRRRQDSILRSGTLHREPVPSDTT